MKILFKKIVMSSVVLVSEIRRVLLRGETEVLILRLGKQEKMGMGLMFEQDRGQ